MPVWSVPVNDTRRDYYNFKVEVAILAEQPAHHVRAGESWRVYMVNVQHAGRFPIICATILLVEFRLGDAANTATTVLGLEQRVKCSLG